MQSTDCAVRDVFIEGTIFTTIIRKGYTSAEAAETRREVRDAILITIRDSGVDQIGVNSDVEVAIVNANRTYCWCNDLHRIGCTIVFAHLNTTEIAADIQVLFIDLVTGRFAF